MTLKQLKEEVLGEYCQMKRKYEHKLSEEEIEFLDSIVDRTLALVKESVPEEMKETEYWGTERLKAFGYNEARTQFLHNLDILEGKET